MKCSICHADAVRLHDGFDDRYGYPGRYGVWRCNVCGHRSLDLVMTPDELSELYTEYYPRSELNLDLWSPYVERGALFKWWHGSNASAFRWVPRNMKVLDIGCGFGESLGYHRARGCDAEGVEADGNILRVGDRFQLKVRVGLFDSSDYEPASFDYVTLDQVIEHVSDPLAVLSGIEKILKPGGTLVISTPNAGGWGARLFGVRWVHWHTPYHQQFFTPRSMALAAQQAGLTVEQCRTVTNSAWLHFQWGHLLTYPQAGEVSCYWKSRLNRTTVQRMMLKLLSLFNILGVNALMTRVFDSIGLGDNMLLLLRKPIP